MTVISIQLVLSVTALIIATISFLIGTLCYVRVLAMEKSTHTVQMVPMDEEIDAINKKYTEECATSDKAIDTENSLYKDDLEDNLTPFAAAGPDKEIFSL